MDKEGLVAFLFGEPERMVVDEVAYKPISIIGDIYIIAFLPQELSKHVNRARSLQVKKKKKPLTL